MNCAQEQGVPLLSLSDEVRCVLYRCLGQYALTTAVLRQTCPWVRNEITNCFAPVVTIGQKSCVETDCCNLLWHVDALQLDGYKLEVIDQMLPLDVDLYQWEGMFRNAIEAGHMTDVTQLVASRFAYPYVRMCDVEYSWPFESSVTGKLIRLLETQDSDTVVAFFSATRCLYLRSILLLATLSAASYRILEALPVDIYKQTAETCATFLFTFMSISICNGSHKRGFSRALKCIIGQLVPFTSARLQNWIKPWRDFEADKSDCDEDVSSLASVMLNFRSDFGVGGCLRALIVSQSPLARCLFDSLLQGGDRETIMLVITCAAESGKVRILKEWMAIANVNTASVHPLDESSLHAALLESVDDMNYLAELCTPIASPSTWSIHYLCDESGDCTWSSVYCRHYIHVGGTKDASQFEAILRYLRAQYAPDHVVFAKLFIRLVTYRRFQQQPLEMVADAMHVSSLFQDTSFMKMIALSCESDRAFDWMCERFQLDIEPADASCFIDSKAAYFHSLHLKYSDPPHILLEALHRDTGNCAVVTRLVALEVPIESLLRFRPYVAAIVCEIPHLLNHVPTDSSASLRRAFKAAVDMDRVNLVRLLIARGIVPNYSERELRRIDSRWKTRYRSHPDGCCVHLQAQTASGDWNTRMSRLLRREDWFRVDDTSHPQTEIKALID